MKRQTSLACRRRFSTSPRTSWVRGCSRCRAASRRFRIRGELNTATCMYSVVGGSRPRRFQARRLPAFLGSGGSSALKGHRYVALISNPAQPVYAELNWLWRGTAVLMNSFWRLAGARRARHNTRIHPSQVSPPALLIKRAPPFFARVRGKSAGGNDSLACTLCG